MRLIEPYILFFYGVNSPCLHCTTDPRLSLQCKSYRRLRDPTSEWSFRGETARFTDFCRSASLERSAVDRGCFSKCSSLPCNGQCSRAKTSWRRKRRRRRMRRDGLWQAREVAWWREEVGWEQNMAGTRGWLVCRFCSATGGGRTIWAGGIITWRNWLRNRFTANSMSSEKCAYLSMCCTSHVGLSLRVDYGIEKACAVAYQLK